MPHILRKIIGIVVLVISVGIVSCNAMVAGFLDHDDEVVRVVK